MEQSTINKLQQLGYSVKVDKFGYMVYKKNIFVTGAGTNRNRKLHWRHAQANIKMYLIQAWNEALKHSKNS